MFSFSRVQVNAREALQFANRRGDTRGGAADINLGDFVTRAVAGISQVEGYKHVAIVTSGGGWVVVSEGGVTQALAKNESGR